MRRSVDIDRLFEEAGRAFSHGLQMEYWRAHAERDATEVKVEAIVLARNAADGRVLEGWPRRLRWLYDQHKKAIHKLKEQRRSQLREAAAGHGQAERSAMAIAGSIDFKRLPTDPLWERHLYVEGNGQFRAELGNWEAGVLKEELANPEVVGWLRNVDRKPWSLEIPYETGGDVRPMFPDLVVVRKVGSEFDRHSGTPRPEPEPTTSRRPSGWRSLRRSTVRCSGAFS
jgi:type III restriction enzyme